MKFKILKNLKIRFKRSHKEEELVPSKTANTRVEGGTIYYELYGKKKNPPLIFIHGIFGNTSNWEKQIREFMDDYYVITYDVRGHGKSGHTSLENYDFEVFVDDLEKLVEHLDLKTVNICGFSLGGMIAQAYAARNHKKMERLILVDTFADSKLRFTEKFLTSTIFNKAIVKEIINNVGRERAEKILFEALPIIFGKHWIGEEWIEKIHASVKDVDTKEIIKIWNAAFDFQIKNFGTIEAKSLIILGEYDKKIAGPHAKVLSKMIDDDKLLIIKDAGHAPYWDEPEEFNEQVREFLRNS